MKVLHTLQIRSPDAWLLLTCNGNGLEGLVFIIRNTQYFWEVSKTTYWRDASHNQNKKLFLKFKNHSVKSKNYLCAESALYVWAVLMLFRLGLDEEITQLTGLMLVLSKGHIWSWEIYTEVSKEMWKFEACLKGFGFVFQKDILLSHMANAKSASP